MFMYQNKYGLLIVSGRQNDAQTIKVSGVYTLLRKPNTPWGEEAAFLGKCASTTAVTSWKFWECNPAEEIGFMEVLGM